MWIGLCGLKKENKEVKLGMFWVFYDFCVCVVNRMNF